MKKLLAIMALGLLCGDLSFASETKFSVLCPDGDRKSIKSNFKIKEDKLYADNFYTDKKPKTRYQYRVSVNKQSGGTIFWYTINKKNNPVKFGGVARKSLYYIEQSSIKIKSKEASLYAFYITNKQFEILTKKNKELKNDKIKIQDYIKLKRDFFMEASKERYVNKVWTMNFKNCTGSIFELIK